MEIRTYQQATDYLFSRRALGMKLGLENVRNLLARIGNPEKFFPSIHVAGTNGKGSTVAILESILREAGYKTGRFTSPHLIDMRERILIRGEEITADEVVDIIQKMTPHIEATNATFFEILTALAFLHFSRNRVEIAILETGLGGRLDATNLVHPVLTVITEIGLEHTRILGNSLESIAREKAGMLKQGVPCVCGASRQRVRRFFEDFAATHDIPIDFSKESVRVVDIRLSETGSRFNARTPDAEHMNLHLSLLGRHQIDNAALALLGIDELRKQGWNIPEKAVREGLKTSVWPARLHLLQTNPKLLVDSAHNPMGASRLAQALRDIFEYDQMILLFGVLRDKNYRRMIGALAPLADRIVLTQPLSHRALDPHRLLRLKALAGKQVDVIPDIPQAWQSAVSLAKTSDLVCATGSIYFVGEVLRSFDTKDIIP